MRTWLLRIVVVAIAAFVAIQVIPYGRDHTNPPVTAGPAWDSPQTLALARTACFDCHSNETTWPWYSNVAPISWRLQNHVTEGREKLNFSEWGTGEQETDEIVKVVQEGEMPPADYLILHPEARLSAADTQRLIDGLAATFGAGAGEGGGGEGGESGEGGDDD